MRTTVGPLPPAIYWRRRAVVLGALLLLLFVVVYSCVGSSQSGPDSQADPTPTPSGEILTPTTESSAPGDGSGGEPGGGTSSGDDGGTTGGTGTGGTGDGGSGDGTGDGGATGGQQPAPGGGVPGGPVGADPNTCTDDEILLTAAASQASAQRGVTLMLQLRVQNVSSRSCVRDVGADPQELYLKRGAEMMWSSDTCGAARGSDVQTFAPGAARDYQVSWSGRAASKCANDVAAGDHLAAGEYQLFARLAGKVSEPFVLTITN
ncbi:hypothetical protein [Micromonospora sp. NBC_01813]|uniref:hypothetical protein n=1 Tax=Micromonospora sp. NBC_01813 TaxID=2975988 RepID=UPI002DD9DDF6|nr:hypothetical protein [Micromonospora sp. NBC_01813]WSA06725.1 hypothetical protein OG958_20835 [Micromonospora sp. NBC_01813]